MSWEIWGSVQPLKVSPEAAIAHGYRQKHAIVNLSVCSFITAWDRIKFSNSSLDGRILLNIVHLCKES